MAHAGTWSTGRRSDRPCTVRSRRCSPSTSGKHDGRYYIYIPFIPAPWAPGFGSAADLRHPRRLHRRAVERAVDLGITGPIDPGHVGRRGRRGGTCSSAGPARPAHRRRAGHRRPRRARLRRLAVSRRLGHRGLRARGARTVPPRRLVLPGQRGRRHGRPADRPHGDRGPLPVGPRPVGERAANPIVRTCTPPRSWWSRGHADRRRRPGRGDWWMVYHGYENGYRTLGRQVLLEPVEWTEDGWLRALGGDLSGPMPSPVALDGPARTASRCPTACRHGAGPAVGLPRPRRGTRHARPPSTAGRSGWPARGPVRPTPRR